MNIQRFRETKVPGRSRVRLSWQLGASDTYPLLNREPDTVFPATVPGSVQSDAAKALSLPDWTYGSNVLQYAGLSEKYWRYFAVFDLPEPREQEPFLVFEGIEYEYEIFVNGRKRFAGEGMNTPVEIPLSDCPERGNRVDVVVFPAPVRPSPSDTRREFSASCKAPFSYGWDWSPKLVSLGICKDAYVEYRPALHVREWDLTYVLDEDRTKADLSLTYRLSGPARAVRFVLFDPAGSPVVEECVSPSPAEHGITLTLPNPELWWPAGHGPQPLYTAVLQTEDDRGATDTRHREIGFRRVRLVPNEGEWERPDIFPFTQNRFPFTFEINGRRIFVKGSNWVPPRLFPSELTPEVYREQLELVRDAHMNLLRVWGGGFVNHDEFYELCDRYGILVWQEFPLACADYSEDRRYLNVLEREATSVLRKLRGHPCLCLWCGGNELFNNWSRMTIQSQALRLLQSLCFRWDPQTPFLPTSPVYGMVHGHYNMRDEAGTEILTLIRRCDATAYTEFGCAAPSPYEYLQTFIPPEELENPNSGSSFELHHAFKAWRSEQDWFSEDIVEWFAGKQAGLRELCEAGSKIQAYMYGYLFEEIRKQWPYCSAAVNWCFNEPWPTAAGNSLINWPARPKPAYRRVQNALRPIKASLRIDKLLWFWGETFEAELWLLNDSPETVPSGSVAAFRIAEDGREIPLAVWHHESAAPFRNLRGITVRFPVPEAPEGEFHVLLRSENPRIGEETFPLLCRQKAEHRSAALRNRHLF